MANQALTTDMQQVLDQRQVWFTNLLLLGFDTVAQEKKTKVNFCRFAYNFHMETTISCNYIIDTVVYSIYDYIISYALQSYVSLLTPQRNVLPHQQERHADYSALSFQ